MRKYWQFPLMILSVLIYALTCFVVRLVVRDIWEYRRLAVQIIAFYSRFSLWSLGFKIKIEGQFLEKPKGTLFVCNHMSYLDILILSQLIPCNFVTSQEMRETPGLGYLTELGGCVYVERRDKRFLDQEIREISTALSKGLNVIIFPEATSTNGEQIQRFRTPLFQAAINVGAAVQPLCLIYEKINGQPVTTHNRDQVFWYDDMSFLSHLWELSAQKSVDVKIKILPLIETGVYPTRRELAEVTQKYLEAVYEPPVLSSI